HASTKIDGRPASREVGSCTRAIRAAAATYPIPVVARAHSGPANPTSAPARGAPRSVAMTWPVLSSALARSHRRRGARIGNSERAPPLLSGRVNDDTNTIDNKSGAGNAWRQDRPAPGSPVAAATR